MIYKTYTFQYEANKFLYGLGKGHQQYSENFRSRKLSTTKQHLEVLILSDDFLICKVIINNEIINEILNSELNQCIIWEW